jgi:hypothetical protein
MIALDPTFVACAYAVLGVIAATILGVAIAVLVIEHVAEVRADRHYRRRQERRRARATSLTLKQPRLFALGVMRVSPIQC